MPHGFLGCGKGAPSSLVHPAGCVGLKCRSIILLSSPSETEKSQDLERSLELEGICGELKWRFSYISLSINSGNYPLPSVLALHV